MFSSEHLDGRVSSRTWSSVGSSGKPLTKQSAAGPPGVPIGRLLTGEGIIDKTNEASPQSAENREVGTAPPR